MGKTQLSSSEIQDLIIRYQSELKKLVFQMEEVEQVIAELEGLKLKVVGREKAAITAKFTHKSVAHEPFGRQRGVKISGARSNLNTNRNSGYKLSSWDEDVLNSINQAQRVLITQDIIDYVAKEDKERGANSDIELISKKVTRSLQKLANRRGDIAKVAYKGKGYAYAMPEWINSRGKLDKQYSS